MLDNAKYQKSEKFIVVSQKDPEIIFYYSVWWIYFFWPLCKALKDVFAQK